jgi:succinoglycan biosynthesis transport protein ExoP
MDSALALAEPQQDGQQPSGMNLSDVIFILIRHKWKIVLFALVGFASAAAIYFFLPSDYESQAKLLVRYVVERSAVDGVGNKDGEQGGAPTGNVINSELEILKSSDLALQVAQAIGVERLMKGFQGKITDSAAALGILKSMEVTAVKESNIISVSYKNKDPKLAVEVLQEIVKRYLVKHLEVHRSLGTYDFVSREADQLHAQMAQTEEELKRLKDKIGVSSITEAMAANATEVAKVQSDLDSTDAELASQKARLNEIDKFVNGQDAKQSDSTSRQPNNEIVDRYQVLLGRVSQLRQTQADLLSRYTPQNRIVKAKQVQLDELEKQKRDLEKQYAGLIATAASSSSGGERPDLITEKARLVGLQTSAEVLKSRLKVLQERSKVLADSAPQIAQLERTKDVQEANYRYFGASLEKARIDETLDPSRVPNINLIQSPSPAAKATRDVKKVVMGLAGGGIAGGLAIALLIDLVLDRTVKRSRELETRLRIPLLLTIPDLDGPGQRFRLRDAGEDSEVSIRRGERSEEADTGELLRPFCEAIRDRLGLYFEANRMTHKPKLVAVTGISKNAGASTLAAGLAATLSETADGTVLLIDKPVAPKRFYDMMTEFKASNLDYVVFDMPSLGDTTSTLPMAAFMDKVLLVVEAEKSNRDAVTRAYNQLSAKSDVSVVFNKSRTYGPKWLEGEL